MEFNCPAFSTYTYIFDISQYKGAVTFKCILSYTFLQYISRFSSILNVLNYSKYYPTQSLIKYFRFKYISSNIFHHNSV